MHIQRINSWGHPLCSVLPEHYLRFLGSFSQMNHPICWFLRRNQLKIGRISRLSMSFTVRTTEEEANELMGSSLEEQLWGLRLTKPRPNLSPAHEIFCMGCLFHGVQISSMGKVERSSWSTFQSIWWESRQSPLFGSAGCNHLLREGRVHLQHSPSVRGSWQLKSLEVQIVPLCS